MLIPVILTNAQVQGLKKYLADLEGDKKVKIGRAEIRQEIQGIVWNSLQAGAVYDYIRVEEEKIT